MDSTSQTPFDNMTQTRELQMLKTMLPYMKESQNTAALSMCSVEEDHNNMLCMLEDLRGFCTEKEQETLDMLSNMFSMLETYETLFS